ncbi:hypothetical protein ACFW1A_14740 [Kitasatospora sp. NPDC058965]|uniref:hypothetical protein n=1 Tax=Kitasatospora sp. NPDC058965 TaxID=3346682 RepID=UPI003699EF0C
MILTASSALVFAVIAFLIVRSGRVTVLPAAGLWLSGFTVAGTGLSSPINHLLAAAFTAIAHIH